MDAAQRRFAQAKDLDHLRKAIELKLKAQEDFARWWDLQERPRGRPEKRLADGTLLIAGRDGFPARQTISRWRDGMKGLEAALERARAICEGDKNPHGTQGTGENEWYTPGEFIESARSVMGSIDLDPATSALAQEVVRATRFFTKDDDGLTKEWCGNVWLNPPYAQPDVEDFVVKMVAEYAAGRTRQGILLTNSYSDTQWFHHAQRRASAITFTKGRIQFIAADGQPKPVQGQAFFYFGNAPDRFASEFSTYGFVVAPFARVSRVLE